MKKIILIGGGGHALSVYDSVLQAGEYEIVGYTDISEVENFPCRYLGNDDVLSQLYSDGVEHAFVSVGFLGKGRTRDNLYHYLSEIGFQLPAIVDKSAVISQDSIISEGAFIGKGAVINTHARIGKMAIVNTGALVEHSCKVGDFSHIAGGAVLCGEVEVGNHTLIGAGTSILQGIKIGNDCIIGIGSRVLCEIPDNSIKYGLIK